MFCIQNPFNWVKHTNWKYLYRSTKIEYHKYIAHIDVLEGNPMGKPSNVLPCLGNYTKQALGWVGWCNICNPRYLFSKMRSHPHLEAGWNLYNLMKNVKIWFFVALGPSRIFSCAQKLWKSRIRCFDTKGPETVNGQFVYIS